MMPSPAPATCPTPAAPLPAQFAAWQTERSITAATAPTMLARTQVMPGRRVELMLAPIDSVRYAAPPTRPGAPTSFGGMASFTVARAGTYRVALGTAAWIDMVEHGHNAVSVAHAPGPACSGIRKMVDFRLMPRRYTLQIAGSNVAAVPLLVMPLP